MKEEKFEKFLQIIESLTGMVPPASHRNHIRREIEKYLHAQNISGDMFLDKALSESSAVQVLLNISTINETYFFREERQFRVLQEIVLPGLFRLKKKLLIWSVSCSTGEEAVSLAILANEECGRHDGGSFSVFATDINTDVLENLEEGVYGKNSFRKDGIMFHQLLGKYCCDNRKKGGMHDIPGFPDAAWHRGSSGGRFSQAKAGEASAERKYLHPHEVRIESSLMNKIKTARFNVYLDEPVFLEGVADIVFFRNTLLYVSQEKRKAILEKIVRELAPGGFFFLASSEVPFVDIPCLELCEDNGVYYFRKEAHADIGRSAISEKKGLAEKEKVREKAASGMQEMDQGGRGYSTHRHEEPEREVSANPEKINEILLMEYISANYTPGRKELSSSDGVYRKYRDDVSLFLESLNKSDFIEASARLGSLKQHIGKTALFYFLEGKYFLGIEKPDRAKESFRLSAGIMENFWPARFYFALSLAATDSGRAMKEFMDCSELIEKEIDSGRNIYSFLLEGFDPAYFLHMCRKWHEKTRLLQHQKI